MVQKMKYFLYNSITTVNFYMLFHSIELIFFTSNTKGNISVIMGNLSNAKGYLRVAYYIIF